MFLWVVLIIFVRVYSIISQIISRMLCLKGQGWIYGLQFKKNSRIRYKSAVWDCDNFKSIGLDGINFGFVKEYWREIKNDVMRFISEFHRNGKLTKNIKCTFIVLISKVESPHRLNDYRHISLVERLYKILAKVLANRLRNVKVSVISDNNQILLVVNKLLTIF